MPRGATLFPKLIGTVAGGLAGLVGLRVLEINRPNLNVFHILVWHWGVVLISSLAGACSVLPWNTSKGGAVRRRLKVCDLRGTRVHFQPGVKPNALA